MVRLFRQLWPEKNPDRDKLLRLFDEIMRSDQYELLCAETDRAVAGFASLALLQNFWQEGMVLYITTMIIDEKQRGKGLGKALMDIFR